jgi:hypothetical protein
LTTIHTQDYRDASGDAAAGRVTLPIAYPTLSRPITALLLITWSWIVSRTWRLDDITAGFMGVFALFVGVSFVARTDVRADTISSHLYNVSFHSSRLPERCSRDPLPGLALRNIYATCILQVELKVITDSLVEYGPANSFCTKVSILVLYIIYIIFTFRVVQLVCCPQTEYYEPCECFLGI